jgi:hypothetical protein
MSSATNCPPFLKARHHWSAGRKLRSCRNDALAGYGLNAAVRHESRDHTRSTIKLDQYALIRDLVRGLRRVGPVVHGLAPDRSVAVHLVPADIVGQTVGTHFARRPEDTGAGAAAGEKQSSVFAATPERRVDTCWFCRGWISDGWLPSVDGRRVSPTRGGACALPSRAVAVGRAAG